MKGWQLLLAFTVIFFGAGGFLSYVVLPFIAAGPAFIVADVVPPLGNSLTGTVYHLTEQDFTDHPVLEELVKKRKRVIRPGSTLNFLLGFFGGPAYSWMPISKADEDELFARYRTILEFNRTYFQITFSR